MYLGTSRCSHSEREQLSGFLVAVLLNLCEGGSMALNRLADTPISAVELHGSLDLERGGVGGISRDTDEDQPLLVRCYTVVDDLSTVESWMAVEDLLWRRVWVCDGPVVHRSVRDHSNGRLRNPLPKNDIFVVDMRFHLLLGLNVEYLQCPCSYRRSIRSGVTL